MDTRSRRHGRILGTLLLSGAIACGESNGPPPSVQLVLRGHVQSAEPTPVPVVSALVSLKTFLGLTSNQTLKTIHTDGLGNYELTYRFTSICQPEDATSDWLDVSAPGYETATTFAYVDVSGPVSNPVIHCTSTPQVIDFALVALGTLRVTVRTSGAGAPLDRYVVLITGLETHPLGYSVDANGELELAVRPGTYPLELTEMPAGCTVGEANPRTVTVSARGTTATTFEVTCGT